VQAAEEGAFGSSADDGFEFGLRCVLSGLGALITARA